jgi:hypothetical protein
MRKENEFGNFYHEITFSREDLEEVLLAMRARNKRFPHIGRSNIIDRIEKELGIE